MLGAELGYLNCTVRRIDDILLHALYLIAEHNRIALTRRGNEILQRYTSLTQFDRVYPVALAAQLGNGIHSRLIVFPVDHILGTKSRLVYLGTGRSGSYTAQHDALHTEGIACAEHRAHIMQATHIVKHHNQGQLLGLGKCITVNAPHLCYKFLFVHTNLLQSTFLISPSRSYAVCIAKVAARLCDRCPFLAILR